jgi:pimeloyl-ACP methyl ester carboxylesterase
MLAGLATGASAQAEARCPGGMRCGSVTVPLDRQDPSAGTIAIHYAMLPHTDEARPAVGTIVPNPGGPGQSAIASAPLYIQAMAPLRRDRDLLLIDARGTGESRALSCPSKARRDPLSLDWTIIGRICGAELGRRAGLYGSAAVADDIDAVRAALGLDKLDLWGDSYGTFLMPVYAARHPTHVRSIVLDGAFPIASDPWGRDVLPGVRRIIGLVCKRTHRCSGPRVLTQIGQLASQLRHRPVRFTAHSPLGPVRLTLGERELANVTVASDPRVFGLLPAAVAAALDHDLAPLKRLVTVSRIDEVRQFVIDPTLFSAASGEATACHDYPRPYDLAASPATRRAQYARALAALAPAQFRPFSAQAWLGTEIDAGPKTRARRRVETSGRSRAGFRPVVLATRRGIWQPPRPQPVVEARQGELTFHVFSSEWYETKRMEGLEQRTLEYLSWALSGHLLAYFAPLRLDQITAERIDAYRAAKVREREQHLVERPLGNASINRTVQVLAQVLDTAQEYGHITTNPARGRRRRLKVAKPRRTWLELDEVRSLLDAAGDHRPLLATMTLAGLRVSEACQLRWRDATSPAPSSPSRNRRRTPAGAPSTSHRRCWRT